MFVRKNLKLLSLFCSAIILAQFLPTNVSAEVHNDSLDPLITPPIIEREDITLRERCTKHYLQTDGSYIAVIYNEPVHYLKNNEWVDIDNSLQDVDNNLLTTLYNKSTLENTSMEYLENKDNPFKVQIPKILNSYSPILLNYKNYEMKFCFNNITNSTSNTLENGNKTIEKRQNLLNELKLSTKVEDKEKFAREFNDNKMSIKNSESSLLFTSVKQQLDVEYHIYGETLKENLVLYALPAERSFSFDFKFTDLNPVLEEDNSVVFFTEEMEPVFIIIPPYMYDNNDELSTDIDISLELTTTGCRYTLIPNRNWLEDPAREFPITIDPTIKTSTSATNILDNGVNEYNPTTNYYTLDRIYVGSNYSNSRGYESRMYIKFDPLPTLPSGANVTYAALKLNYYANASWQTAENKVLDLHRVNFGWDSKKLTWNSQKDNGLGEKLCSITCNSKGKTSGLDEFNITKAVASWYNGSANNGVMIRPNSVDNGKTNRVCYYSSDQSNINVRPQATINYLVSSSSATAGITNGGIYYIKSAFSSRYLDVYGFNYNVVQHSLNGASNQQWQVRYEGNGFYSIIPLCKPTNRLDVANGWNTNGTNIQIHISNNSTAQRFRILSTGNGNTYAIQPQCSTDNTHVLDVTGPSKDESVNIQLWEYANVTQQHWIFEPVNTILFEKLDQLYNLAKTYDSSSPLELSLQYIRRNKYNSGSWSEVAGAINQNFVSYVNSQNAVLSTFFAYSPTYDQNTYVYDKRYGKVDLIHMVATMNGIMKGGTSFESLIVGRWHVANLSGWAGDLQTLIIDTIKVTNNSNDYYTFMNMFFQLMGDDNYSFSLADLMADVDAYNLINDWIAGYWGGRSLGTALNYYYNGWTIPNDKNWYDGYDIRFQAFLNGDSKETFKSTVAKYTDNFFRDYVYPVQWPLFKGYTIQSNQSNAARDAFTDYIWNKYLAE